MTERLFKVLGKDGAAFHGGTGKWGLPTEDGPGEWMPPIEGELAPCENGYHGCREQDLVKWLGPTIYEMEVRGERIDDEDKIVVREARLLRKLDTWNERTARLFACDCAEAVLHIFEEEYPDDHGPRQAIEVARRYANGGATDEELAAAWDAAWAAAWDAARDAAWDAARAAALAAARAAALAAAWAAAWTAARDAARDVQTELLVTYLYPNES